MQSLNLIESFYAALKAPSSSGKRSIEQTAQDFLHKDVRWSAAHPINNLQGPDQVVEEFLKPIMVALPDMERKPFVAVSDYPGSGVWMEQMDEGFEPSYWIDGTGYFVGTFANALFGIPPTGRTLYLRYTEMVKIENQKVVECYLILDFLDAMSQAGVNPIRESLGHPGLIMPPTTLDGLQPKSTSLVESNKSAKLVLDMLDCLGRYDGTDLLSMDLENYWHPDFVWYGPGGIGTTRGIDGFRNHHQGPFLKGFPDRSVDTKVNIIASGNYVATGGWPHMSATHTGADWLGLAPGGKELSLRVMDIWRREGDLLKENWVGIDIIDMLMQMGLDVFTEMEKLQRAA